jgi:hypothetical protein
MAAIKSCLLFLGLTACSLAASLPQPITAGRVTGIWVGPGEELVFRHDGTWSSHSLQGQRYGSWHISDDKLIQINWSGTGPFMLIWVVGADDHTLWLRLVRTARGHPQHIGPVYKRLPALPDV